MFMAEEVCQEIDTMTKIFTNFVKSYNDKRKKRNTDPIKIISTESGNAHIPYHSIKYDSKSNK